MPANTPGKSELHPVVFFGIAAIAVIILVVLVIWVYATFGAAVVYGYTWLAGNAPVFNRLDI